MAKDCLSSTADIHKETHVSQLEKYTFTLIQSDPREVGITIIQRQECSLEMEAHWKKKRNTSTLCLKHFF